MSNPSKIIFADGVIRYYNKRDQLHNLNGPAVIFPDGSSLYYVNGLRHRGDGPAAIYPGGEKRYYLNDIRITDLLVILAIDPTYDTN